MEFRSGGRGRTYSHRGWAADRTWLGARVALARETREELGALREMVEAGAIRSIVDRVFPMEEAAGAHGLGATGERRGAVVIEMA